MPIKSSELKWVGVDLDKTIADNTGYPDFLLTEPMPGAKEALHQIQKLGYKVIVFTARSYAEYSLIEGWLTDNHVPFRRIICGKPLLKYMIDDRNIEFDGDWSQVLDKIQ